MTVGPRPIAAAAADWVAARWLYPPALLLYS